MRHISSYSLLVLVPVLMLLSLLVLASTSFALPRQSTWGRIKAMYTGLEQLTLGSISCDVSMTEAQNALRTVEKSVPGTGFPAAISVSLIGYDGQYKVYSLSGQTSGEQPVLGVHFVSQDGRYLGGFHVDLKRSIVRDVVSGEIVWKGDRSTTRPWSLEPEGFSSEYWDAACGALGAAVIKICMAKVGPLGKPFCYALGPAVTAGCVEARSYRVELYNPFPDCPECPAENRPKD